MIDPKKLIQSLCSQAFMVYNEIKLNEEPGFYKGNQYLKQPSLFF